jgi:homoserine kinase
VHPARNAGRFKTGYRFEVIITKQIKPGSGIGSSAATAGAVVVANELLGNIFQGKNKGFAMFGEKVLRELNMPTTLHLVFMEVLL